MSEIYLPDIELKDYFLDLFSGVDEYYGIMGIESSEIVCHLSGNSSFP